MIIAACAILTAGVFLYVFFTKDEMESTPEMTRLLYLRERKEVVYENLRDLNFEYKAGKVPDADYSSLKSSLEEEAAAVLAEISHLEQAATKAAQSGIRKGAKV